MLTNKIWFGDGTFKIVPKVFYQLYVLHVQWSGSRKTIPVLYALMSGKSKENYLSLFDFIKASHVKTLVNIFLVFAARH